MMESSIAPTKGPRKRKHPRAATRSGTQIRDKSARTKRSSKMPGGTDGSKPPSPHKQAPTKALDVGDSLSDRGDSDSSESEADSGNAANPFEEAEESTLQENAVDGATEDQSTTAANGSARRGGNANHGAVNGDFVDPVHSSLQEQLDNSKRENQRLQGVIEQLQERLNLATKQYRGEPTGFHHLSKSEVDVQRLQEINKELEESLDSRAHELYKSDCEVERLQNVNKQLDERLDQALKRDAEKWAKYELVDPNVEIKRLQMSNTMLQKELDLAKKRANWESKQGWTTTADHQFRLMNRNFKQLQWNLDRSKAQHRQEAFFADKLISVISGEGVKSEVYRRANAEFPEHFPITKQNNLFFPAPENIVSQDALEPWFRTKTRIPQKPAEPNADGEDGPLYCYCKRPESFDNMVQCDGECEEWFHYRCVGFDETSNNKKWFCNECSKNKAENADEAEYGDEENDEEVVEYKGDDDDEYEDED